MSYYLMHRGWQGNEAFGRDEFSRRDAWVWLVENAAFAAGRGIERGQIRTSLRELGRLWRWQDPRVRRCLANFRERRMIDCAADASGTLITVCNYEAYQPTAETQTHHATHDRRTNGSVGDALYKEGIKEEEDSEANASGVAEAPPDPIKDLWNRGKAVLGNTKSAGSVIGKMRREHGDAVVLQAIVATETELPSDPASFFIGCCNRAKANGHAKRLSPGEKLYLGFAQAAEGDFGADSEAPQPLLDRR